MVYVVSLFVKLLMTNFIALVLQLMSWDVQLYLVGNKLRRPSSRKPLSTNVGPEQVLRSRPLMWTAFSFIHGPVPAKLILRFGSVWVSCSSRFSGLFHMVSCVWAKPKCDCSTYPSSAGQCVYCLLFGSVDFHRLDCFKEWIAVHMMLTPVP